MKDGLLPADQGPRTVMFGGFLRRFPDCFFHWTPISTRQCGVIVEQNRFDGRSFLFIFRRVGFPAWNEQTRWGLDPTRPDWSHIIRMQQQFGPLITDRGVTFRLWAPTARRVDLLLDRPVAMTPEKDGWYVANVAGAAAGTHYKFRIDDEVDVPDPASAFQPQDVFGPGEVIDHSAFAWQSTGWRGRPWHETVILEAHVGTFTREGSYRAAIDKLDHLVATGITALELMPLADFAGRRNWGYDGVLWYAPDSAYGRPDDLKALIDAAHQRGLMVFLDVVYNHFGPEGNYLGRYAPEFFTDAQTPWGSAIDFRRPEVRAFAIESAMAWLRDYRFDGLRLDAVHAIVEPGQGTMLRELSAAVGELAAATGRHIHLMLENDDNAAGSARSRRSRPSRQIPRAVERRLPPRMACAADGRDRIPIIATTGKARCRISPARSARALSIRANRRSIAAASRAANRAARCPRWPSSTSCRTTIRSATARSATALPARSIHKRSKPRLPSPFSRRQCRCCSWARSGDRRDHSPFSAIFVAVLPTPCAEVGKRNSQMLTPNLGTRFRILSTKGRLSGPVSIGTHVQPARRCNV